MKMSPCITGLAPALIAAQRELKALVKDAKNPDFGSRYVTLDAMMDAVRPVLAKHALAIAQGGPDDEDVIKQKLVAVVIETILIHESGEWIQNAVVVPVLGRRLKGGGFGDVDAQAAGSAVTYGRRYGLAALLALASDDDDDGNAVSQRTGRRETPDYRYPTEPVGRRAKAVGSGSATSGPGTADAGVPQGTIRSTDAPVEERSVSSPVLPPPPPLVCGNCGGTDFFDNRKDKRSPKSPDFRCKKCRTGIWLDATKEDGERRAQEWLARTQGAVGKTPTAMPASVPPDEALPPLDDAEGPLPDEGFFG